MATVTEAELEFRLKLSEIGRNEAETRYLAAQARYEETRAAVAAEDLHVAAAAADAASRTARIDQYEFEQRLVGDGRNRVYNFVSAIDHETAGSCIDIFRRWHRLDDLDQPFTLMLTSPGGDAYATMRLRAAISNLVDDGRTVRIIASGMCMSGATVVLQAASEGSRVIEPGCLFMIHEASFSGGSSMSTGELADLRTAQEHTNTALYEALASRSGKTVEEVAERARRRDWYLSASEVVSEGFADRIGGLFDPSYPQATDRSERDYPLPCGTADPSFLNSNTTESDNS